MKTIKKQNKMKTMKTAFKTTFLVLIMAFVSCTKDDAPNVPNTNGDGDKPKIPEKFLEKKVENFKSKIPVFDENDNIVDNKIINTTQTTNYEYNADKFVSKTVLTDTNDNNSDIRKTEIVYNYEGQKLISVNTTYYKNNIQQAPVSTINFIYDNYGNIIGTDNGSIGSTRDYIYENGELKTTIYKIIDERYNDKYINVLTETTTFKRDEKGNILERAINSISNDYYSQSTNTYSDIYIYTYDNKQNPENIFPKAYLKFMQISPNNKLSVKRTYETIENNEIYKLSYDNEYLILLENSEYSLNIVPTLITTTYSYL